VSELSEVLHIKKSVKIELVKLCPS
jgi:hypothetical protein